MSQYTDMGWREVKKLVKANGGNWVDAKTGIEFLEALEAESMDNKPDESPNLMTFDAQNESPDDIVLATETDEADDCSDCLNKNAPFGEVFGTGIGSARFYQDGKHYDIHGNLVEIKGQK